MKKSDKTRSRQAKTKTKALKQARELTPKVTFVGGKWYNEKGEEVPKPQPPVQATGQFVVAQVQGQQQQPLQGYERGRLVRLDGCTCAKPELTGHVPGCKYFLDALYVCEKANRATIVSLAALANSSIADLERRRIDYAAVPACGDDVPVDTHRRRCWRCPYWQRHPSETPFDHQKQPTQQLDQFPEALAEEDDDLPF